MSRFSPNTWVDAIQLPFAMVQFKGNIYIEPIAPDVRPAAFLAILFVAIIALALKTAKRKNSDTNTILDQRPSYAIITASLASLAAWIISSGNGRYGITAIGLCSFATLASLLLITSSRKIILTVLLAICGIQIIFLTTADPDDTWSRLTLYRWNEAHADRPKDPAAESWRHLSDIDPVLVVTTKTLTGMSILYGAFGPEARYMSLGFIDDLAQESPERKKAANLIQHAKRIYYADTLPIDLNKEDIILSQNRALKNFDSRKLSRFGLLQTSGNECVLLPQRMGARLLLCNLTRGPVLPDDRTNELPEPPYTVLKSLIEKCPKILGEPRPVLGDGAGGVLTSVGDGKYFIEVMNDLNVYLRHRSDVDHHLVLNGELAKNLSNVNCHDIVKPGSQYW